MSDYLNKPKELIKKMTKSLKNTGQENKAIKTAKKMPNLKVNKNGLITFKNKLK